jgi:hypothetical protein
MQYNPVAITSLRRMNNRGLSLCDFRPFVNLEELNLANNKITDITNMGLDELKRLRVLDISNNLISTGLKELAFYLEKMKALECVAVRGNPVLKTEADRKKLIGFMDSMKEVSCGLQVIDTVVSIDERIEAWKAVGGHPDEAELLRYKAIMFQRLPRDVDVTQVLAL